MQLRPIDPVAKRRRMMLFTNNGGSGLRQALLDGAPFLAELTHSLVLQRGTGSPTFTRASTATVMGYGPTDNAVDGLKLLTVAANEARFVGARRISEGVWSNTFADGSLIPAATNTGYLPEDAATQLIAVTADIRDMTTANWVLGATMTRARTSVGADGVANSATRLTGGAVAATNTILYTVVAAASSRTYSALVRRVTGTGPVRIIQTGTETDISPQLNTVGYALVQLTASVLNVAMGFKIDTNGDAIDVDFNQFESATNSSATSRIATGGGVRNKDELEYTSAGSISGTAGWAYAEITFPNSYIGGSPRIIDTASVAGIPLLLTSGTRNIALYDGTASREGTALPFPTSTPKRVASTWGGAVSRLALSGVTTADAFDGAMTTTSIRIGYDPAIPGNALNGTIRNVHLGLRLLSASEMQAITR